MRFFSTGEKGWDVHGGINKLMLPVLIQPVYNDQNAPKITNKQHLGDKSVKQKRNRMKANYKKRKEQKYRLQICMILQIQTNNKALFAYQPKRI